METAMMHLKILLPFGVFADVTDVKRLIVETQAGSVGFLPNRLDCTAQIVAGILMYESKSTGEMYVAVDGGVMVKTAKDVRISVRNAIGGTDLGKLHQVVDQEFLSLDKREKSVQTVIAKLESSFIRRLIELQKK